MSHLSRQRKIHDNVVSPVGHRHTVININLPNKTPNKLKKRLIYKNRADVLQRHEDSKFYRCEIYEDASFQISERLHGNAGALGKLQCWLDSLSIAVFILTFIFGHLIIAPNVEAGLITEPFCQYESLGLTSVDLPISRPLTFL
ncbi:hypothetical protein J6590_101761 [Homalodisca vitripennis]|nr:hypothetical protein J6590_101761 [Homalodisca vitripennis]